MFVGPFAITFALSMFILIMQFLWKYIDDLAGKGLEWYVIGELIFYASAHLVPMALPLAVLLSSIMTLGSMAENNELIAAKSAGVSLISTIKPLGVVIILVAMGAFLFANYTLPKANLQFGALLWDIKTKKPAFDLQPGIFYNGIDDYSIRVKKKDDNKLYDILIYDHTSGLDNNIVIRAEEGTMYLSPDEQWLTLNLKKGVRYEEIRNMKNSYTNYQASRTYFDEYSIRFDLSSFKLDRTDISLFRGNFKMLRMDELVYLRDSVIQKQHNISQMVRRYLRPQVYYIQDSLLDDKTPQTLDFKEKKFIDNFPPEERKRLLTRAGASARTVKYLIQNPRTEYEFMKDTIVRYEIEWYRKIVLAFSIVFLFLIGAPMGAIIRKGGLGLPGVVSLFLFIAFYIISIIGEKLARKYIISSVLGMWLPIIIIGPVSIFLLLKANRDSIIFRIEYLLGAINKWFGSKNFVESPENKINP